LLDFDAPADIVARLKEAKIEATRARKQAKGGNVADRITGG
jgi:hypothetical protein